MNTTLQWARQKDKLLKTVKNQYRVSIADPQRRSQRVQWIFSLVGHHDILSKIQSQKSIDLVDLFSHIVCFFKEDDQGSIASSLVVILKLLQSPIHSTQSRQEIVRSNLSIMVTHRFIHGDLTDLYPSFSRLFLVFLKDPVLSLQLTPYYYHVVLFMSNLIVSDPRQQEHLLIDAVEALSILSLIYQLDVEPILCLLDILHTCSEKMLQAGLLLLLRYYQKLFEQTELNQSANQALSLCGMYLGGKSKNTDIKGSAIKIMICILDKGMVGLEQQLLVQRFPRIFDSVFGVLPHLSVKFAKSMMECGYVKDSLLCTFRAIIESYQAKSNMESPGDQTTPQQNNDMSLPSRHPQQPKK